MSSGGPGFWLSYWAVMLSVMGGSMSWALHDQPVLQIVWIALAVAAVLIVRRVSPSTASGETLTIIVLCITAFIAYLQWQTLEKTDITLRNRQRAFVFLEGVHMSQLPAQPQEYDWLFVAAIQNNGATQTKNLISRLACRRDPKGSDLVSRHSVLGPMQTAGACSWPADDLARIRQNKLHIFMQGDVTMTIFSTIIIPRDFAET
jgi:hypothetical protein